MLASFSMLLTIFLGVIQSISFSYSLYSSYALVFYETVCAHSLYFKGKVPFSPASILKHGHVQISVKHGMDMLSGDGLGLDFRPTLDLVGSWT